jgi:geranylgeranyl pyrophosphate synthase
MRYAVTAGGKRIRPALALAACRAAGGDGAAAVPAMVGIELLHTYTLIHDDLPAMDDDDLRRGRPTCHIAFDEATAILAGDALHALAFELVATLGGEAVRRFGAAVGSLGVVGGQQDDLDAELRPPPPDVASALVERIHRRKTAALIRVSCELGGIAGGAGESVLACLAGFGEAIGLAFQIVDDILDCTADTATLGKTAGKDAAAGKLTWVSVHGLAASRAAAAGQLAEAEAALSPLGAAATDLRALGRYMVARQG